LISVTALVTVVFVLIFYPYVTFRGTRYVLEADLEALGKAIASAEAQAEESRQLLDEYRRHMRNASGAFTDVDLGAIENAAPDHARLLATIRQAVGDDPDMEPWLGGEAIDEDLPPALRRRHPELTAASDDPCFWRTGDPWISCTLNLQVGRAHTNASAPFGYKRISHLRNDLFVPLYNSLSELRRSFGAYLLGNAPTWDVDGAKPGGSLQDQYSLFIQAYHRLLSDHERFIYDAMNEFQRNMRELQKARESMDPELENVVARLEEMKGLQDIQTPFGQLPIGLNELVLLFPVLLAAGFVLCASLFSESLKLRQEFHRLSRGRDPEGMFFDDERIALVAPVWVDPLQPSGHRVYRGAILALPLAVFVIAIFLLFDNSLLFGPFMKEARLPSFIYLALYVISALSIVEGGRRVWRALLSYQKSGGSEIEYRSKEREFGHGAGSSGPSDLNPPHPSG
jgi:hypothetical protein